MRCSARCVLMLVLAFVGLPHLVLAGKIRGTIRKANGTPFAGALIQAMDSDINPDDYMGDAITNSNGRYTINYSNKRWDGLTGGGPDIYIQVIGTDPRKPFFLRVMRRSKKYNNQNKSVTRTINLRAWSMVHGTLTYKDGSPGSNLRVKAMDDDPPGNPDDLMGKDRTNSGGKYKINYWKTRWDGRYGGGPDIYLLVSRRKADCTGRRKWWRVHKSTKKKSHNPRNNLRIDRTIAHLPTVYGTVTSEELDGAPVPNAKVIINDFDLAPNPNDYMGCAWTDDQGKYEVVYARKNWDGIWNDNPDVQGQVFVGGHHKLTDRIETTNMKDPLRYDMLIKKKPPKKVVNRQETKRSGNGGTQLTVTNYTKYLVFLFVDGYQAVELEAYGSGEETWSILIPCGLDIRVEARYAVTDSTFDDIFDHVIGGGCFASPVPVALDVN